MKNSILKLTKRLGQTSIRKSNILQEIQPRKALILQSELLLSSSSLMRIVIQLFLHLCLYTFAYRQSSN